MRTIIGKDDKNRLDLVSRTLQVLVHSLILSTMPCSFWADYSRLNIITYIAVSSVGETQILFIV